MNLTITFYTDVDSVQKWLMVLTGENEQISENEEIRKLKREIHNLHSRMYYMTLTVFILGNTIFLLSMLVLTGDFIALVLVVFFFLIAPFYVVMLNILYEMRKEAKKHL